MRILRLQSENVKRLKVIDITPNPAAGVIKITGRNAQGKTSVIDSIVYTLAGTEDLPSQPIRRGADKGGTLIDLGDFTAMRKYTPTGSVLRLEGKKGETYSKPQTKLDEIFGRISFDPLAFTRLKPKEQAEMLRSLVRLEINPDQLDAANGADYEARKLINREINALTQQIAGISIVAELPAEPIDVSAKIAELEKAGTHNAGIETIKGEIKRSKDFVTEQNDAAKRLREQAAETIKMAEAKEKAAKTIADKLEETEVPEPIDTAALREEIENARATNTQIDRRSRREELEKDLAEKEKAAQSLTDAMKEREATKAKAIGEAKMPIDGLGFKDGEVMYQDLPLTQASGAEQLRVSLAIAMAGNPQGRVILVKDGSLLDDESMDIVTKMAIAKDYQIWIEMVDTTGKVGIVIEDGMVAAVNEDEEPVDILTQARTVGALTMVPADGPETVTRIREGNPDEVIRRHDAKKPVKAAKK